MTTLRQAAQQALDALENVESAMYVTSEGEAVAFDKASEAITTLREALAQPEQEPSQWRDMIVATLVREGINKHKARELADHFAAQRQWVGLTEENRFEIAAEQHGWEDLLIAAEAKLKERNT